jgi:hypothetical protein
VIIVAQYDAIVLSLWYNCNMHTTFKSKLINLFSKKEGVVAAPSFNTDFSGGECKCIQQDFNISETTKMNTTRYIKSKEVLRVKSKEVMQVLLKSNNQRDLFEAL